MTQKPKFDYDIIVIGSGTGGSPAASIAARSGKRVAIIEKDEFGGESPNWGEVPLGAMLHAANIYDQAKESSKFGLRTGAVGYNYPSLLSWRDTVVKRTGAAGNRRYYEKQNISTFNGMAHFLSPNEISVNRRHLSARKFLIATGSEWQIPDIPGIQDTPYYTPKNILSLTRPPKSVFIIGSGSTAIELASLLSIFGTKIYLSDTSSRLLPEYDEEVSDLLSIQFDKHRGMTLLPQTRVVSMQKVGLQKRVTYSKAGTDHTVKVDEILIADKRTPVTDLGLENAGVKYNTHGIVADEYLQTSARHIFTAGSCVFASSKIHDILIQSRVAANNLLRYKSNYIAINPHLPLQITRTQPEIARVGLSEDDCLRRDLNVKTNITPLTMVPKSNITDQRLGFVKLIADKKGVLLGATVVAPNASEMIHELTLAVKHSMTAEEIYNTPHDFASWSEVIRVAAGKLL